MKKIIFNNIPLIISFLFLFSLVVYGHLEYKNEVQGISDTYNKYVTECSLSNFEDEEYISYCNDLLEDKYYPNFFSEVSYIIHTVNYISMVLFFTVSMPSLYYISKYLKNGIIKNELTRKTFKKCKINLLAISYKGALILPIIAIVMFVLSYANTKTFETFNMQDIIWENSTTTNPYLFIIMYLINITIHSILYCNISLCIVRKKHNYYVSSILSYLTFIAIELILELGINTILLGKIFKINLGVILSIFNVLAFNDSYGVLAPLVVPTIMLCISYVLLYFMYKDKEKLIIDCN